MTHNTPNLDALVEESKPGCCLSCDKPLPKEYRRGRIRKVCDDRECQRTRHLAWMRDNRIREKERLAKLEEAVRHLIKKPHEFFTRCPFCREALELIT